VRRVAIGVAVALTLLVIGEVSPGLLPVNVSIEVRGAAGQVAMDGGVHDVQVPALPSGARIRFEEPGPVQREYQLDGSDTTSRDDRNPDQIRAEQNTPWYRLMGWLRDEASYSRWQNVQLIDLANGQVIASGRDGVEASQLPSAFRVQADLRRPEAPARIWLESPSDSKLAGVSIERANHQALWEVGDNDTRPTTWFFPNDPWPFAAELIELIGRSAAAAVVLFAASGSVGWAVSRMPNLVRRRWRPLRAFAPETADASRLPTTMIAAAMVIVVWLTAVLFVTVRL
jgi:hypothetical protein